VTALPSCRTRQELIALQNAQESWEAGGSMTTATRLPLILLALTAVTGIVDAVSYLALGRVFTANMTGNVVLLGFAVAGAPGLSIPRSATALLAFFAGAVAGGRIASRMTNGSQHLWAGVAFGIESLLVLAAAVVSMGPAVAPSGDPSCVYCAIVLTALAMGVRNAVVHKLGVPDLTTTVLTLTIAGLASESSLAGGSNPRWARRLASVALMFAGAAAGVLLLRRSLALALAVSGGIAGVCALVVVLGARSASAEPATS
jgi:uncharacterized membrane protein YoaK (UPF0700 family)